MNEPGKISDHMFRAIFDYDLCIAVLSGANPNVYYELAVAQSASRPVIILIEKGQPLPFDVKDFRSLEYDLSITSYEARTYIGRLVKSLEEIEQRGWKGDDLFRSYRKQDLAPSILDPKPYGIRIQTPHADATVSVVNVEGMFEALPTGYELRSLRYYPDQQGFVPHGKVLVDRHNKTWRVKSFDVGGEPGNRRGIEICLAGPDAAVLLDYWNEAHLVHREAMDTVRELTGGYSKCRWLPSITSWPRDLITCHRIDVTRK
jgi:hypothetical protein